MPASSLLPLLVSVAAALQPPAGFQNVPIDGKTQVMVARKGDVYFIVRDLPGALGSSAEPADVAVRLIPEATGRVRARWDTVGGLDVIRFQWGDDELGAVGVIGAHGSKTRVATCQWGVGLQRAGPEERKGALDACKAALAKVTGFEAPPAAGNAPPPAPELMFVPPPGFEWRSDGSGGWLGIRGGDAKKGGGEAMGLYELPFIFDTKMDVSRVTDEVSEAIAVGLKLEAVEVAKLRGRAKPAITLDVIHITGRVGAGPQGAAVEGFLVPRGRTTILVFVMKQGAVSPELMTSLRNAAAEIVDSGAPAVEAQPAAAPDAVPIDAAAAKAAKRKADGPKKDETWKAALVVLVLVVAAVGLSVAMGLGRSRRRRRRSESPPPDATPSA